MSNVLAVTRNSASPATVRAWLSSEADRTGNDTLRPGTRGKFSADQIRTFNKANGTKYSAAAHVETREVVVTDSRGRKVIRKVNVAEARALLAAHGVKVANRGRLSQAQLAQAWELGNDPVKALSPEASSVES